MDKVFIEGLEIEALIGIYDWERRIRQPLVFDLEMAFDNRGPAASDAIEDTLDYKAVSKRLIGFVSESSYGLVETLAEQCASLVLREFGVEWLRLKLRKPGAVRGARAVGVEIERSRADLPDEGALAPAAPARTARVAKAAPASAPVVAPEAAVAAPLAGAAPRRRAADHKPRPRSRAYLSLGSNLSPEQNLRTAVAALRERFGEIEVSPVYRTASVGFQGPDFLNAIVAIDSDIHPFALNDWLHALEEAHGRDRRDASYSNRPLDIDIIYFGELVLDGPGDFQLPRPELHHAFVLKPLVDLAPDFVDPIRGITLAKLWSAHPEHATPPTQVDLHL
jgi:2-amino-4-hydroxy-6-hydroxymethyldihydropteridine diphosphokinase